MEETKKRKPLSLIKSVEESRPQLNLITDLKKNDSPQGLESTSNSLPSGGITDLNSLASGSNIPSPLTPQGQQGYLQEQQVKQEKATQLSKDLTNYQTAYKQAHKDNISKEKAKVKEETATGGVGTSFMTGLANFNKGLYKSPRYIYDFFASPQNKIADMLGMPELSANYEAVKQATGFASPLTILDNLGGIASKDEQYYSNKTKKYDDGIVSSLSKGKFSDAGSQIVNNIAQSVPSMLGMAITNGVGSIGNLGYIQKTLVNALPFASSQNEVLKQEGVPDYLAPINGALNGLSEVIFDQSFGTQAAINKIVSVFQNEGRDLAVQSAKEMAKGYLAKAMKGIGILKPFAGGSAEEMTTQFAQNLVDKYTINPDKDLTEGVLDAGLVGSVMTGGIETGGLALAGRYNSKQKAELTKLSQQRSDIVDDLDNPSVPDNIKETLNDSLGIVDAKIEGITEDAEKEVDSLPKEVKDAVKAKQQELSVIEEQSKQEDITDTTKGILKEQAKNIESEINEIIDNSKPQEQPISETVEPTETVTDEVVAEPVTEKISKPKTLKELENENRTTLPKIPTKNVFLNDVAQPSVESTKQLEPYFDGKENELPTAKIAVSDIVPTQKNLTIGNLEDTQKVSDSKEPIVLLKEDGKYYVQDGHHRIANDILNGKTEIEAKVFDTSQTQTTNEQGTTIKETKVEAQPIEKPTTAEQVGNAEDTNVVEPVTKLQTAKEKLAEKRKVLKELDINLSVSADPKQKAKALYEYHSALVDVAKEYINEGIKTVEDFAKELGEKVSKTVKDAWREANGETTFKESDFEESTLKESESENLKTIGITKKEASRLRETLGEEQYQNEVQSRAELVNKANKMLEEGYSVPNLIKKLDDNYIASAEEVELIRQYYASLTASIEKNPTPELIKERKDILATLDFAKTRAGRAVQAFDGLVDVQDNLADFLEEESVYQDLTSEEVKDLTDKYNKAKEAKEKLQEKYDTLLSEARNKKAQVEITRQKKIAERNKVKGDFKAERKSIINDFRAELKKIRSSPSAIILPYQRELIALAPFVKRMTESYVREGIYDLKQIIKNIHNDVSEDIPELTEDDVRDILAGKYANPKKTKNAKLAEIRDLEQQARLMVKLDELESGINKSPEKVTRNQSQAVKDLQNAINEIKKRNPELTYPSKLEGRKTWFKNQIEKLKQEIAKGEFDPIEEPIPITLDAEALKLKDEYIAFRDETRLRREKKAFENRNKAEKVWDAVQQGLGLRRLIQTSIDVSIPFRQGVSVMLNPRTAQIGSKAYSEMWNNVFSSKKFQRMMFDMKENPIYGESLNDGIVYTEVNSLDNLKRDEEFRDSFLFKIPYLRVPFRASERAAASWTNYARMALYELGVKRLQAQGKTREANPQAYKDMSARVMVDTGRGKIPGIQDVNGSKTDSFIKNLGGVTFYGLRLMSASFRKLNPLYYLNPKVDKTVRVEALKDMAGYLTALTTIGLAATVAGFTVSFDEDDPDYLKLRHGKKVIDITGGQANYVRTFVRLAKAAFMRADPTVNAKDADKYANFAMASTRNFFRNKLAPNTSYSLDFLLGQNSIGEKFNPYDIIKFYPMYTEDMIEAFKSGNALNPIALMITEAHGVGSMNYDKDVRRANIKDYLSEGKDDKVLNFLKSNQLNIQGDINQEIYSLDKDEKVKMTKDESDRYERFWAEYVIDEIKENMPILLKARAKDIKNKDVKNYREELTKEITSMKSRATKEAKNYITGFDNELAKSEISVDGVKKELSKMQLKDLVITGTKIRTESYQEYYDDYYSSLLEDGETEYEAKKHAKSKAMSLIREETKAEIIEKYEGKLKDKSE